MNSEARVVSAREWNQGPYLFRCEMNPSAPTMVVDDFWTMQEMAVNPEWVRVDENGQPITTQRRLDEAEADAAGWRRSK